MRNLGLSSFCVDVIKVRVTLSNEGSRKPIVVQYVIFLVSLQYTTFAFASACLVSLTEEYTARRQESLLCRRSEPQKHQSTFLPPSLVRL